LSYKQFDTVIIVVQLLEDGKSILYVPLGSSYDAGRIQTAGVCFLDAGLQVGPNLLSSGFAVPIVKFTVVQAALQQQMHCVVEQLLGQVRIVTKDLYLLAILAASEEDFGGILRGINAPEQHITLQECSRGGMSVGCHHLFKYLM
jgi:hypothetical protein